MIRKTYAHNISSKHIISFFPRVSFEVRVDNCFFVKHPFDCLDRRITAKITPSDPLNNQLTIFVDKDSRQIFVWIIRNTLL